MINRDDLDQRKLVEAVSSTFELDDAETPWLGSDKVTSSRAPGKGTCWQQTTRKVTWQLVNSSSSCWCYCFSAIRTAEATSVANTLVLW